MSNSNTDFSRLDWAKSDGLLPAIVQHWWSGEVLMLGFMNAEALAQTQASGKVTFYSRSKQRLWTKGESSGYVLALKSIRIDCDADTLLVQAEPRGPSCHLGTSSCFGDSADVRPPLGFLAELDALVSQRHAERPEGSYTTKLFDGGMRRMAQKVGEERRDGAGRRGAERHRTAWRSRRPDFPSHRGIACAWLVVERRGDVAGPAAHQTQRA